MLCVPGMAPSLHDVHVFDFVCTVRGMSSHFVSVFDRASAVAGMLQEYERHLEEGHPDRGDTQRSIHVYNDITVRVSVRSGRCSSTVRVCPTRPLQQSEPDSATVT